MKAMANQKRYSINDLDPWSTVYGITYAETRINVLTSTYKRLFMGVTNEHMFVS